MDEIGKEITLSLRRENAKLRELLWLHHGCNFPALYGDDGEMQCNKCRIDFRRDEASIIEQVFYMRGLRKVLLTTKGGK